MASSSEPGEFTNLFSGVPAGFAAGFSHRAIAPDGTPAGDVPRRLARALQGPDVEVTRLVQIHGRELFEVDDPARPGTDRVLGKGDALISRTRGRLLTIFTADCVPLLLVDPESGWMAAIHAGWRGTALQIVATVLDRLEGLGALPSSLFAFFGPSISGAAYEVGPEVVGALRDGLLVPSIPENAMRPGRGDRWLVDLALLNREVLRSRGVPDSHIQLSALCTFSLPAHFPSYRRDGAGTGRIATGILRLPV
jgi:YfiH family protein